MQDFRTWLRAQRYSPNTIRNYSDYVIRAARDVDLPRATSDQLTEWCSTLTANCAINARKALVAWYTFKGRRPRANPALEILVGPTPKRRPRPHQPEVRLAFIEAAARLGGEYEVAGLLFAWTGARFTSVRRARWHQFDLTSTEPTWEAVVKAANRSGPRTHTIPLHPGLVDALVRWAARCGSRDWLFPGQGVGGVMGEYRMRSVYRTICESIDLNSVPHRQRHTLATALLSDTGDLTIVQELLGHADPKTARMYADVPIGRVRAAVDGLESPCPQLSA